MSTSSPIDPDWPRAVLFDLDGTLVDSAPDLRAAVNELIARHGLPPLSLEQVRPMIGHGVGRLVERAFAASGRPLAGAALEAETRVMVDEIYGKHLAGGTVLLPGAHEALEALKREGKKLAVVTNKPHRFTRAVLDHYGLLSFLDWATGGDNGIAKKPAPDMLLAAVEAMGLGVEDAVMVGDGPADVEAARAAGMPAVLVEGGYSDAPGQGLRADFGVPTLHELPDALREFRSAG